MSDSADETVKFIQGLNDVLMDGLKRSSDHIAQLRRENVALKAELAAGATSLLTELQDRVTLLEGLLEQRKTHFERRLSEIQETRQ